MKSKASTVNGVNFRPEHGNFTFPHLVQMSEKRGYGLRDTLIDAPFELVFKPSQGKNLTSDEISLIKEVKKIAEHAVTSIPSGLAAVCTLMAHADMDEVEGSTINDLGWFMRDMVGALEQLNTIQNNCDYALLSNEELKNKTTVGQGVNSHE